jgi:hypothetical protein
VTTIKNASWYRSKLALERLRGLVLTCDPHITPDGFGVFVSDLGGLASVPGKPDTFVKVEPKLVMQASDGHDLMQIVGRDTIKRVEFPIHALPDLEALEEWDHLPEPRKDYTRFKPGTKLSSL